MGGTRNDGADALGATAAVTPGLDATAASSPENDETLAGGAPLPPRRRAVAPGDRLGRFVVIDTLGEGGMGIVVAAYDPDLDRKVAVKLLRADAWSEAASPSVAAERRERMLREARAMGKLTHPNVLTVHEVGTAGDQVFIAMEFAAGGTLRQWCKQAPRSWRELVTRFAAAGRGLEAAHRAELVHRDFKPDNVLITAADEVRVADFGLVTGPIGSAGAGAPGPRPPGAADATGQLTVEGSILGTPAYMAPEQFLGDKVGAAADQFAFCVALWEELYGARPFAGRSYGELAETVLAGKLQAPPDPRDVPPRLRAALERGMARDPEARWPSMTALLAELTADPEKARRARLQRVGLGLGALAVIAGAIALVATRSGATPPCGGFERRLDGVWDGARRGRLTDAFAASGAPFAVDVSARAGTRLDGYAKDWVDLRVDACRATRVRGEQSDAVLDLRMACLDRRLGELDALVGVLVASPNAEVVSKAVDAVAQLVPLAACSDVAALSSRVPPPENPATRAAVDDAERELARVQALRDAGQYRDALSSAEPLAGRAHGLGYAPLDGEVQLALGDLRHLSGDDAGATDSLYAATVAAAEGHDATTGAEAWVLIVKVLGASLQQFPQAETAVRAATAAVALAGHPPGLAGALLDAIGQMRGSQGRYSEALAEKQQGLALRRQAFGDDDVAVARSLINVGSSLDDLDRYDEAIAAYQQAMDTLTRAVGGQHPLMGTALNDLGATYGHMSRPDDELRVLRQALAIDEATYGTWHEELANVHNNLAGVMQGTGDLDGALRESDHALEIVTHLYGPDHPEVADALITKAGTLGLAGKDDDAEAALARARVIDVAALGAEHPRVAQIDAADSKLLARHGHIAEAEAAIERAIAATRHTSPVQHGSLGDFLGILGDEQHQVGQDDVAIETYRSSAGEYELDGTSAWPEGSSLGAAGELELARGRIADAVRDLRRAIELDTQGGAGATDVAEVQMLLARALWTEGRDRAGAVAAATAALEAFRAAGPEGETGRAGAAAWLARHR